MVELNYPPKLNNSMLATVKASVEFINLLGFLPLRFNTSL